MPEAKKCISEKASAAAFGRIVEACCTVYKASGNYKVF
jgi:hypothetical protein